LSLAGDARMIAKQRRFAYEAEKNDFDQVAYGAVLEGMGYKAHTRQFGQLARRLPYSLLRGGVSSAKGADAVGNGVRLTQALLFGAASLLPAPKEGDTLEAKEYMARIAELWRLHGPDGLGSADIEWKKAAVRPANLPERRIAGAAHVMARSFDDGFFESILSTVLEPDPKKAKRECVEFLSAAKDDFWSYRYSAHGKKLAKAVSLIGRERAMTIVVNSFIPLGLLHARSENRREDEDIVHRLFRALPSLPPNNTTRLMEYRMFGASPKERTARTARTQQGLLQVFADWCSEDPSCQNCGIFAGLQSGYIGGKIMESTR
jgi:hypothetical protein